MTSRLAAECDDEIVLVEPGRPSTRDEIPRFFDVLADASLHRIEEVSLIRGGPKVPYLQANALGGGSAINGMLLTGDVPPVAEGLVSEVSRTSMGRIGSALVDSGGSPARLWWNDGRWNPGRAVLHLCEEGRVSWVQAAADSLLIEADRVVGVGTDVGLVEADMVVLCLGALATPILALRSGIDACNERIGRGLQDHPSITFAVPMESVNPSMFDVTATRSGRASDGAEFLVVAHERASSFETEIGLVSVMLLDPVSRGSVTMLDDACLIDFNMLDDVRDVVAMREATRFLMSTVGDEAFRGQCPEVLVDSDGGSMDDLQDGSDSDLDGWIARNLRPVFHAAASCSTAQSDPGRIAGVEGLHVADASALERVPRGTPAADVTMVAENTARAVARGA